ncbi:hypothetical protein LJC60_02240 [Ruminococcaceae bacterium OttesenSCG-928-D13]|nr:hypothetical protein [Ruminococcaceae bacterium OttesenSCG-928-D13]
MAGKKVIFSFRTSPETHALVNSLWPRDNCKSQNEFIEKAVRFYTGYLASQDATEYTSKILLSVMKGIVQDSEHRVRQNIFKLATEVALNTRIISTYEGIEDLNLSRMRGQVIHDLKRTNGQIHLEDAVRDSNWRTLAEEGDA